MTIDMCVEGASVDAVEQGAIVRQKPRILIVDDEPEIAELLEMYFGDRLGYDVSVERCTNKAADRILVDGEIYHCLISDYNNEHASGDKHGGRTLFERLRKANACPPLYYMISGNHNINVPEGVEFVRKPFSALYFGRELQRALSNYASLKN